jgi:hypothetical protein
MNTALIPMVNPVDPHRPVTLEYRGGTVFLYLHDLWYASRRKMFLQLLKRVHADVSQERRANVGRGASFAKGRHVITTGSVFRAVKQALRTFELEQSDYYAEMGVDKPHVRIGNVALPEAGNTVKIAAMLSSHQRAKERDANIVAAFTEYVNQRHSRPIYL